MIVRTFTKIDYQWSREDIVAEGDKAAARFIMRGTHQGTFFGVPPSGKSIIVQAMNFYHLQEGQIIGKNTDNRTSLDCYSKLEQYRKFKKESLAKQE